MGAPRALRHTLNAQFVTKRATAERSHLAPPAHRDPRKRLAHDAVGDQRRVVIRTDCGRDDLDDVEAEIELMVGALVRMS